MNISYKVEDESFKVTFCPDNQGLNLKKKNHSYMQISKDLKKLNSSLDYEVKLVDVAKYFNSAEEYQMYIHTCDDHLNKVGNEFVANKIYQEMKN